MEFYYQCIECGRRYEISSDRMVCPFCSEGQSDDQPLRGVLETVLEGGLGNDWRVRDFLPIPEAYFVPAPIGNTPLWEPQRLRRLLGRKRLFVKDDSTNPTGSFKDRASLLVSAFAARYKHDRIVLASTGNAGSSMAGIGAAAGQEVVLFLPESAPAAKYFQARHYGATVYRVKGNYDRAYDLSLEYSSRYGGLNRNTVYNPMTIEGKKTVSLELFRQLGSVPDYLFVPVGDGCILSGLIKGFKDLMRLGLVQRIPEVVAVQSEQSNAIHRAFENGGVFSKISAGSRADSLNVDVPRGGHIAVHYLAQHGGRCLSVSENDILQAQSMLSKNAGLFTEPAGATAFAGYLNMLDAMPKESLAVVLATGSGLKDIASGLQSTVQGDDVIDSIDDIADINTQSGQTKFGGVYV